jgi:hypothetical protein
MDTADLHLRQDLGVRSDPGVRSDLGVHSDLGVRPGESDPAGMLCRVLVLLAVVAPMAALALAWWLA